MSGTGPSRGRRARTSSASLPRELLRAAETVLIREGAAGLTVRAVAAEAGVAPMGVYNRLGGKAGLLTGLLTSGFDQLREFIEVSGEPGGPGRLRACCLRYREFALASPHFYGLMFDECVISDDHRSAGVGDHAAACFEVLLRNVELAAAAGALGAPDEREAAQQIWGALHGAVALELRGLVRTPDPAASYHALLDTILRGLFRQPAGG